MIIFYAIQEREIYQKPTKQKLQNMRTFKEQGNEHFKNQRYQQASHYYNKVVIFGDYTFPDIQTQQRQMDQLLQQANCNLGITLIKLNQSKKSIQNLHQVIKGPSQKLIKKGYYWLVKSYITQSNFQKAKQTLQKMKTISQDTISQIKQLQTQLKKAQHSYQKKSKDLYGHIFAKPSYDQKL